MRVVRRRNTAALQRALDRAAERSPTWRGDPSGVRPAAFHVEVYRCRVGAGNPVFSDTVDTVMRWDVQRGAGLAVCTANDRVTLGGNVVLGVPFGPVMILAPCRVSDVFDEPDRRGFRYVTLPGHPELGFEEFIVERSADGDVWFVVRPVSRPGSILTRIAGPIARLIQRRAGQRYVDAISRSN